MNRAVLAVKYLTRRRSRACFILVVFFVINIMAFTILSIREAANDALAVLEQKPPDCFYLDSRYEMDPNTVQAEGSTMSFLSMPHLITDEVIGKIMRIDGIKTYAAHYAILSGSLSDGKGRPLSLFSYNIPVGGDDAASVRGITDSALYLGSFIKLAAGRHITPDSVHEAMVNAQFAKQNDLDIGDTLVVAETGDTSGIKVTLSGIYEMTDKADETELSPSELNENFIYVDYNTALALDDGRQGTISVIFFVEEPEQLSSIFAQVQKLDMDWNKYDLYNEAETSVIDRDAVKAVSNRFSVMTAVIIFAGFFILTLVLMLQTKMRVNEIAILLSLGFTKSGIVFQHMIEAVIPAGISIAAAYVIGSYFMSGDQMKGIYIYVNGIQMVTVVQIIVLNLCLLTGSIWISCARLLHAQPSKIYEKNN